ncbi:exosortase F system-associated membrane protein [Mesonia aquimarina]|uniref:exosortase F system-associated membrane protein n=1 Tax=Mesonia aquimarina TaxID=1504967 RepID=UPI000EF5E6BB|nr:exosortase F system-associated protein [Mesonia aquimarina]
MRNWIKILLILLLFGCLALIRFFESELFFDPFIEFYKGNYQTATPPEIDVFLVTLNTLFRFLLNSIISLLILWIAFKKREVIKFSSFLFAIFGAILFIIFLYLLFNLNKVDYFLLFYVRRFLIQPVLILLLIPAFYYQQYLKKAD